MVWCGEGPWVGVKIKERLQLKFGLDGRLRGWTKSERGAAGLRSSQVQVQVQGLRLLVQEVSDSASGVDLQQGSCPVSVLSEKAYSGLRLGRKHRIPPGRGM